MTEDELTRLDFVYAEQDRATFLEAYAGCNGKEDRKLKRKTAELVRRLREYRLNRWGKTRLEQVIDGCVAVDVNNLRKAS